jgi:uncharacterized protein YpmB
VINRPGARKSGYVKASIIIIIIIIVIIIKAWIFTKKAEKTSNLEVLTFSASNECHCNEAEKYSLYQHTWYEVYQQARYL